MDKSVSGPTMLQLKQTANSKDCVRRKSGTTSFSCLSELIFLHPHNQCSNLSAGNQKIDAKYVKKHSAVLRHLLNKHNNELNKLKIV